MAPLLPQQSWEKWGQGARTLDQRAISTSGSLGLSFPNCTMKRTT